MTRNQSSLFKFLLFIAGAGIIVLAFFLFRKEELTGEDIFVWISIGVMYIVLALPFLFSAINIANFSGKIPSLVMVWLGIMFYTAASIVVILLLKRASSVIDLDKAILIQAILLFLFIINIYFAYFASSHVRNVAAAEAEKQQYISQLKPKSQSLLLSVNRLPAEYEKAQKTLKQTIEEIRYIYPVDSGAGNDLETQIIRSLNILSEYCGNIQAGARPAGLESEAENLRMLVKERKLLRN